MSLQVVVKMRAFRQQNIDVECVASFYISAIKKGLAFLKEQVVGARGQDRLLVITCDLLLDYFRFQDSSSDSGKVDAEERSLIRFDPNFDEVLAISLSAEIEFPESKDFGQGLKICFDHLLDVGCRGQLVRSCE
jgi:hypothetical protein